MPAAPPVKASGAAAWACRSTSRSACGGRKPSNSCARCRWTPWWWWATARSFRRASSTWRRWASSMCTVRCCRIIAARGPSNGPFVNGETRTGVTTMRIDAGLDTGDMLLKAETAIGPDENAVELGQRLAVMGADLLVETLAGLAEGRIVPEKQDNAQATYAPLLKKEDGAIDWTRDAARDSQPGARSAAVARRVDRLPRPGAAHLEIAALERELRRTADPGNTGRPEAAGGELRHGRAGTGRSAA